MMMRSFLLFLILFDSLSIIQKNDKKEMIEKFFDFLIPLKTKQEKKVDARNYKKAM